jgi:hypothetical protein
MKKTWLFPAVAGIALFASACANNAAPDNNRPFGTTANQMANRLTGDMTPNTYNATNGTRNYNAFTDATGLRDRANNWMGTSIYRDNGINRGGGIMQNGMAHMGYCNMNRDALQANNNGVNNVFLDRDALARIVGNVTASCPGVQQSTVLVTDEECFVGLTTDGGDPSTAKSQARMNAMSVCPGYYNVYVTDNQDIINEMNRIASRGSNFATMGVDRTDTDRSIDALIRRMGGLPDGADMRTKAKNPKGTTSR